MIISNCPARTRAPILALALATGSAGLMAAMAPLSAAHAQAATTEARRFDIPAGPLTAALNRFAVAADLALSGNGALTDGKSSPGLQGRFTVGEGLERLLDGTGLGYRLTDGGVVITAGGDSATLAPIEIEGAAAYDENAGAADRAGSITITPAELERRNPATVKQVFAGEAGVSVGGAIPLSQKVYVNGVEETQLAVSIDGARQNNKVFHHAGTNIIDPSLLKLARVDPGVAPADAGPGALGGSIAYETVDVDDVLAEGRRAGGFASAAFDSNSGRLGTGVAAYGRAGDFEGLGYLNRVSGDDYEDGDGSEVPGTESDMLSYLLKSGYQRNGHRIELSAERVLDDANRPFRANIGDIIGREDPDVRRYELERQNFSLGYSTVDAGGLWDPEAVLGFGRTRIDVPEPYGSTGETSSVSGNLRNRFHFGLGTLTAGVDFFADEASYRDPATAELREEADNVGVFAQARLNPLERLAVSLGARFDRERFTGVDGSGIDNDGVSGNIAATIQATDWLALNAGYSDVFGGVRLAENYILNPEWEYGDIDGVRAASYRAGFEAKAGGFSLEGGIFESDFTDARDESYSEGPTLTTDFKSEGYRLATGYQWGPGFARLSYADTEVTLNGLPADSYSSQYLGTPLGRIIALEVGHQFATLPLTLGGTVDAALENTDTIDAGGQALEAYEVLNVYAEYRAALAQSLVLRVEANNVFDEAYADRATYGQEFDTVRPLAEPGRSFLLMAKLTF